MSPLMATRSADVLIVGAGPAGLYAAERLARAGAHVLVCEEHATIGDPVHCTGILAADSFQALDLPDSATLNTLTVARFVSPSGVTVSYGTDAPLATVIDRPQFDRALASRARAAGTVIETGARVVTFETGRNGVTAIAGDQQIRARLGILACGAHYSVQRRFGLGLPTAYLQTAQRELAARQTPGVELHFGRGVAPDGFAWAVPVVRPDGLYVRVGVMASADVLGGYARMLARVADRWGIVDDGVPPRQKILPLGSIDRTYADRLLVIGDAAGLVKPTTGGGIHYSMVSAALAADVAVDALARDRFDAATLAAYETAWRRALVDEFASQRALRHVVTRLSDAELDDLFELARTDGIIPIVRATARFNQHRGLIRALFRHPPVRRILFGAAIG